MQEAGDRIAIAMKDAGHTSAAAVARRVGIAESTMRAYVGNTRNPPLDVCEKIGRYLKVNGKWLFEGTGPKRAVAPTVVPLVGYVGAGSVAHVYADSQGPFDEVEAPDEATESTVAVEIRGESLGALFDSWLVFYDDVRDPPGRDLMGKLCVVGVSDGRILIKKMTKGQLPGHFTLVSNVEPPIYDVLVDWAARVKTMRPRA